MANVVIVGSVNADIVVAVDRLPARGETVGASRNDTGTFVPGGKGANQAAAVARLLDPSQRQAKFVCQFGNDAHATKLQDALTNVGVDLALAGHPDCPSGQAFVFVYPDGDNSIVIVGGANASWPEKLSSACIEAITSAAIVLLQCEIPAEVNYTVAKTAAQANVPVMWDSGGEDRPIPSEILPLISFLCPNETELSRLAHKVVRSKEDAIEAARSLQAQGARNLLVTLGSLGSVFVPENAAEPVVHQPCLKVDNVVDTTGAGDCYRGAFAVSFAEGRSIQNCMLRAAAASALCVQAAGALPSIPSAEQTTAFLKAQQQ